VFGCRSPYPTVVIVVKAQYRLDIYYTVRDESPILAIETQLFSLSDDSKLPITQKKQAIQCAIKVMSIINFPNLITIFIDSEATFSSNLTNNFYSFNTLKSLNILTNLIIFNNLNNYGVFDTELLPSSSLSVVD
jgi:hypothetical protein